MTSEMAGVFRADIALGVFAFLEMMTGAGDQQDVIRF